MLNNQNNNVDEQQLWRAFVGGSDEALENLYRTYFDELYTYGIKWLKDPAMTQDSIQDLFIKLMKTRKNLSTPASIKFYLFRAFRSVVLDKIRKEGKFKTIDDPSDHIVGTQESHEAQLEHHQDDQLKQDKLADAIQKLTPRQREAIYLKYIQDFSYAEVSEMLDLSPKATYKLMARALAALKNHISLLLSGSIYPWLITTLENYHPFFY